MVSTKEAAKLYREMQERTRKRQREYAERRKNEGKRRLSAWVEADAYDILVEYRKQNRMENGEVLTLALRRLVSGGEEITATKPKMARKATIEPPGPKADRAEATKKIVELHEQGHSFKGIARILNSEGYPTLSGRGNWHDTPAKKLYENRS